MTLSPTFSSEDTEIAPQIEKNYHDIQLAIDKAAQSAGRTAEDVLLVAVSKTVGAEEIQTAQSAGIHDFGENRTNLLAERQQAFRNEHWHFIGRIQTNKLKEVVGRACLIHSVASEHALEVINKLALKQSIQQRVLIEVNISGEESKDGVSANALLQLLELASTLPGVKVEGLMTMAAVLTSEEDTTAGRTFAALRELRDNLVPVFEDAENISLNELSMGMSDDFEDAIKEGATIVRIGRRLWS